MSEDAVPPAARLLRDFVNTYEPQLDEESLTTSAALRDWLVEQRLVPVEARVTDDDLDAARAVREGLREVLLGHAGHDTDPDSLGRLRTVLADFPVRVHLDADGYRLVGARSDAVGRAVGELLDAVRRATEDGTWPRLKVCARDSCRWAFYDASRNQVRRWCSMAGCGNAVKMRRAYAARRARTRQEP